MWLINLGKVASSGYLVFATLFTVFNGLIAFLSWQWVPSYCHVIYVLMILVSSAILWAANRLRNRLYEDMSFDQRDWVYYPGITIGSWAFYFATWFLIAMWVKGR